jgi:hypothetical protein
MRSGTSPHMDKITDRSHFIVFNMFSIGHGFAIFYFGLFLYSLGYHIVHYNDIEQPTAPTASMDATKIAPVVVSNMSFNIDVPLACRMAYGACVFLLCNKLFFKYVCSENKAFNLWIVLVLVFLGGMFIYSPSYDYPIIKAALLIIELNVQAIGSIMMMSFALLFMVSNMHA